MIFNSLLIKLGLETTNYWLKIFQMNRVKFSMRLCGRTFILGFHYVLMKIVLEYMICHESSWVWSSLPSSSVYYFLVVDMLEVVAYKSAPFFSGFWLVLTLKRGHQNTEGRPGLRFLLLCRDTMTIQLLCRKPFDWGWLTVYRFSELSSQYKTLEHTDRHWVVSTNS